VTDPFIAEIRIMAFNFAPSGWAQCNGQILPINQNQALFSILGTTYGGNGQTTFALPDLRGRVPVYPHSNFSLGGARGEEAHTLALSEITSHTHALVGSSASGTSNSPVGTVLASSPGNVYTSPGGGGATTLTPATIGTTGGGQPHENRQPYLTLNFCIALVGIYPSRN
jgi:microcystin-dependent protein